MGGTWWQMVNAVTEHIDHGQNYRGSDQKRAEQRFQNTIAGQQAEFKRVAFDLALQMAG